MRGTYKYYSKNFATSVSLGCKQITPMQCVLACTHFRPNTDPVSLPGICRYYHYIFVRCLLKPKREGRNCVLLTLRV